MPGTGGHHLGIAIIYINCIAACLMRQAGQNLSPARGGAATKDSLAEHWQRQRYRRVVNCSAIQTRSKKKKTP